MNFAPVKVQTNCKAVIFMNSVFSVVTDIYFIDICILVFYNPSPLPQMYCIPYLSPSYYLLTKPHSGATVSHKKQHLGNPGTSGTK